MTDQTDKPDVKHVSANDFFDDDSEPNTAAQTNPTNDIGDQLKDGLKQAGYQAGTNFIFQTILNLLPLPYSHKRNLTRKMQRGEPITIVDIIFGGLSAGRIIRFVISLIIFAVVAYMFASRGLA